MHKGANSSQFPQYQHSHFLNYNFEQLPACEYVQVQTEEISPTYVGWTERHTCAYFVPVSPSQRMLLKEHVDVLSSRQDWLCEQTFLSSVITFEECTYHCCEVEVLVEHMAT